MTSRRRHIKQWLSIRPSRPDPKRLRVEGTASERNKGEAGNDECWLDLSASEVRWLRDALTAALGEGDDEALGGRATGGPDPKALRVRAPGPRSRATPNAAGLGASGDPGECGFGGLREREDMEVSNSEQPGGTPEGES